MNIFIKKMAFIASLVLLCLLLLNSKVIAKSKNPPIAEWNVLIFMNADNNLEPAGFINFNQIAKVGSNDKINVLVQFDRIGKYYKTNPNWKQTLRFRVTKGMEPNPTNALEDLGEINMGDGAALADFLIWGRQKFPAKRTMLVIWDHGQGWRIFTTSFIERERAIRNARALPVKDNLTLLRATSVLLRSAEGVALDGITASFRSAPFASYRSASNDETNNDVLYNREIQDSLKTALNGQKLDIIGYDACLMAMLETAYAMKDVGNYMVASEELEPGRGWDYEDWLKSLLTNPSQDSKSLSNLLVRSYEKTYVNGTHSDPETTLSAVDLAETTNVASTMSNLSDTLVENIGNELQNIIEARASSSVYAPGRQFYHIDIKQFLDQLSRKTENPTIKNRITLASNALSKMVVANYAGSARQGSYGSNGLAIYFPSSESEHVNDPWAEGGYEKNNTFYPVEFVQKERWSDFLHHLWSKVP
jgi:hypothetical protein